MGTGFARWEWPLGFLLRVECPVIARDLGCPVGRIVLRPSSALRRVAAAFE